MILPLMEILGLEKSRLFSIPLLYDNKGNYIGFDRSADVTKMNGKGIVASKWVLWQIVDYRLRQNVLGGEGIVINIGDGILDANAVPFSDAFFAYTGVTRKSAALAKAMLVFDDFSDLTEVLKNL